VDGRSPARALDELHDRYLEQMRRLDIVKPGAARFTDKMPLNETHLGLIALLFPCAPIIHVARHPLDIVLSVFSNNLTHGFQCASVLQRFDNGPANGRNRRASADAAAILIRQKLLRRDSKVLPSATRIDRLPAGFRRGRSARRQVNGG
jgi:hypothetical protein